MIKEKQKINLSYDELLELVKIKINETIPIEINNIDVNLSFNDNGMDLIDIVEFQLNLEEHFKNTYGVNLLLDDIFEQNSIITDSIKLLKKFLN